MTARALLPRRWSVAVAALVAIGAALAWLLHVPYRPERVARAVPAASWIVSRHEAPGPRLQTLAANPLVAAALDAALGPGQAEALALRGPDPMLRALTDDRVMLALAPMGPWADRPTWSAVVWAGARARRLRWQLRFGRPSWLAREGRHGGRPIYRVDRAGADGSRIYFTFEEGLILACLSTDPHDIRRLLDTHDGLRPAAAFPEAEGHRSAPDRVWIPRGGGRAFDLTAALHRLDAGQSDLALSLRPSPVTGGPRGAASAATVSPRWGAWPEAVLAAPTASLRAMPLTGDLARLRDVVMGTLGERAGEAVSVGLFGAPMTGRYRGLRVPALVAATPWDGTGDELAAAMGSALDALNAAFRWGLFPVRARAGGHTLYRIEGTAVNAYAHLAEDEFPAVALVNGHLWIGTNTGTLTRLIENEAPPAPLRIDAGEAAVFRGDGARLASTLRLGLGVYRLASLMAGQPLDDAADRRLDRMEAWFRELPRVGRVAGRMAPLPDGLAVELQAVH
jgi:hypothetical protein